MKQNTKHSRTFATLVLMTAFALFLTFNVTQVQASEGGDTAFARAIAVDLAPVAQLADVATVATPRYHVPAVTGRTQPAVLSIADQRMYPDAEIRDYGNMQAWRRPVTQGGITYMNSPALSARGSTGARQLQNTRVSIGYQNRPRGMGLTIGRGGGEQGSLGRVGTSTSGGL